MYDSWSEHPCLGIESGYTSLSKYITIYSGNPISFTEPLQSCSNLLQLYAIQRPIWESDHILLVVHSGLKTFASVNSGYLHIVGLPRTSYLKMFKEYYIFLRSACYSWGGGEWKSKLPILPADQSWGSVGGTCVYSLMFGWSRAGVTTIMSILLCLIFPFP